MNLSLLLRLIVAHFIADFILQPDNWVRERAERKINSKYLYFHTLIILLLTFLAAGNVSLWQGVLIITISHFIIDLSRSYIKKDGIIIFILDQLLHVLIIIAWWLAYTSQYPGLKNNLVFYFNNANFWFYIIAYLIVTIPSSVLISKITIRWTNDITSSGNSLKDAGKWIGIIERVLILTFIVIDQFEAIGFLIAAKSIFRFSEIKNSEDHKRVEYILIGTLISFSISIFIGIILSFISKIF